MNPLRREAGFSLVELLVVMVVMGIVSGITVIAMSGAARVFLHSNDENEGLRDAKVVLDRAGRDIREARSVVCDGGLADPTDDTSTDPNCAAHLQLWIDDDSDYAPDDNEIVTWQLRRAEDGEHYDVWRIKGNGENGNVPIEQKQASSLIVQTLFRYDTPVPEDANLVDLTMFYDAIVGIGVDERQAHLSVRLRNAG